MGACQIGFGHVVKMVVVEFGLPPDLDDLRQERAFVTVAQFAQAKGHGTIAQVTDGIVDDFQVCLAAGVSLIHLLRGSQCQEVRHDAR